MPYVHRPSFGNTYEFSGVVEPLHFHVNTVPADYDFQIIQIPSWLQGKIERAYLDVYFPVVTNTSVADNYLTFDGSQIYLKLDPVGTANAISIGGDTPLEIPASTTVHVGRIIGGYDLSSVVNNVNHIHPSWINKEAHANDLIFRSARCVLRVMST